MSAPQTGAGDTDALDLPALYTTATNLQKSLKNNYDYNSPRYQESLKTAISTYEKCRELVDALSLFSKNEGIEDVASSELKYNLSTSMPLSHFVDPITD